MSIEPQFVTVAEDVAGERLDSFLASRLANISRTRVKRAIDDGDVLVNDHVSKASYRIRAADRIDVDLPDPPPFEVAPEPIPLSILFEDEDLVVLDKPAGMVVHPGAGVSSGTLANALVYHFNQLLQTAGSIRPGIVHRIDKETSGLLVVAKNETSHEHISNQFRDRLVAKGYIALVYGQLRDEQGEIRANIGRSRNNRTRMAVLPEGAGRPAHTIFRVARRYVDFTRLDMQLKTGRTHQIRVHMAHIGHPVVGDAVYGGGRENSIRNAVERRRIQALRRHFLHSAQLQFVHPRSGHTLSFSSPLPRELSDFLAALE